MLSHENKYSFSGLVLLGFYAKKHNGRHATTPTSYNRTLCDAKLLELLELRHLPAVPEEGLGSRITERPVLRQSCQSESQPMLYV